MSTHDPATPGTTGGTTSDASDASGASGESGARLVRSSGIVAAGTLLSRVTGLARTIMLAYTLGAAGAANVYNLANTTPNLVYDMLLGGILSATLVPVLVSNLDRGDDEGTDAVITVATAVLLGITVAGFLVAPLVMHLYATLAQGGGTPPSAAETQLGTALLRLFVPQILFYGLTTLGTALLNTHRRFAAAAFAPVVNNIVMIGVLLVANRLISGSLTVEELSADNGLLLLLGIGTTAGIAAMAAVLWPAIRRAGIRVSMRFDWRNPSVRSVARLSGWTLGYVLVGQASLFLLTSFALGSSDPQAVSAWSYAYQFFQLPYGVFTVSIMTTFTPELASLAGRGDMARFNERFLSGLRLITLVLLPASVVFLVLARPIVSVLLEHGRLGADDADVTAGTVFGLAWGMVGFSLYLYVLRGFYALKDTRTPFLVNLLENGITVVVAIPLIRSFGAEGLGLAWSLGYMVSAGVAFVLLRRRVGPFGTRLSVLTTAPLARMVVAALAMAVVTVVAAAWLPASGWGAVGTIVFGSAIGLATYIGLLVAMKVSEVRNIPGLVLGSRSGPTP